MSKIEVRTPGEDAPADALDEAGMQAAAGEVADSAQTRAPAKRAKKETMEERLDRLDAENQALREKVTVLSDIARANPKATELAPPVDLPDISEYTGKNQHRQAQMTSAVLTKQGWVAPAHLGANPAALNELQKRGLAAGGAV